MVRRIYVEKKKGFDVEASSLFNDVKENLHLEDLTGVRVLNRYDVDGIDDATYEAAKFSVFAEPAIDVVYEETMPVEADSAIFFALSLIEGVSGAILIISEDLTSKCFTPSGIQYFFLSLGLRSVKSASPPTELSS